MANKPNNARSAASREVIENALITLMQQRELAGISVKDVCAFAKVSRSTFYMHYDNIEAPIQAMEERFESSLPPYFDSRNLQTVDQNVQSPYLSNMLWFEYCLKHTTFLRAILGRFGDQRFEYRIRARLRNEVRSMMDIDNMPNDSNRRFIIECNVASIMALLRLTVEESDRLPLQQIAMIANLMREGKVILKRHDRGSE